MTAAVILHPRAVERFGLYSIAVGLKQKGYDIGPFGARFYTATPEVVPAPKADVVRLYAPRLHNFWWPRA